MTISRFSVYQRLQSPRAIMCCSLHKSGCNTLKHWGFANVDTREIMFYSLITRFKIVLNDQTIDIENTNNVIIRALS